MTVNLEELEELERKAPPVETVAESFLLIHRVATGQSNRSYMTIPADPKRDADLIVGGALEHYAALRNAAVPMIQELRFLREENRELREGKNAQKF